MLLLDNLRSFFIFWVVGLGLHRGAAAPHVLGRKSSGFILQFKSGIGGLIGRHEIEL